MIDRYLKFYIYVPYFAITLISCSSFPLSLSPLLSTSWFAKRGVVFKLARKKKKKRVQTVAGQAKKLTFDELSVRVAWEILQRRINHRATLFSLFYDKYVDLVTILHTNVEHWLELHKAVGPDIERLYVDKQKFERNYTKMSEDLHNKDLMLKITKAKKEVLDREQKALFCSVTATAVRIDNLRNIRWWIAQHMRSQYRRLRVVEARFLDITARLKWVALEGFAINQVGQQFYPSAVLV